jgi:hypothetical protein
MRRAAIVLLLMFTTLPSGSAQSGAVEVWLRAFIPNPANSGQAKGHITPVPAAAVGSVVRLLSVDSVLNLCFATDNRGFAQTSSSTARLETRFTLALGAGGAGSVAPSQNRTTAAVTKKVDCATGATIQEGPGVVNRDHLGTPAVADGVVQVIGQAQGRNVLTPAGNSGPAIDYSFDIQWKPGTGSLTAAVTYGSFPSFEMYARRPGGNWVVVMRHSPTGPPWKLGADSFGLNSHRQVETVTVP